MTPSTQKSIVVNSRWVSRLKGGMQSVRLSVMLNRWLIVGSIRLGSLHRGLKSIHKDFLFVVMEAYNETSSSRFGLPWSAWSSYTGNTISSTKTFPSSCNFIKVFLAVFFGIVFHIHSLFLLFFVKHRTNVCCCKWHWKVHWKSIAITSCYFPLSLRCSLYGGWSYKSTGK